MREIKTCRSTISAIAVAETTDLGAWLTQQATTQVQQSGDNGCWLLAHCEDGVIWGELRGGTLALSSEAFPVRGLALRWETLQQARLFGEYSELLLWRGPQGWQGTLRRDEHGDRVEYFDEQHLLWGDRSRDSRSGFMQVVEGAQGIVHAPPIDTTPTDATKNEARARLMVRHYLDEDETGVVRVVGSRVVKLLKPGEKS